MEPAILRRGKRIRKIRSRIFGTARRPRLSVFRSSKRIYVQAIDDLGGVTIVEASDKNLGNKLTKVEKAKKVGQILGDKLVKTKTKRAVFDRRGYKFHGRVKALAEGIKEKGVVF